MMSSGVTKLEVDLCQIDPSCFVIQAFSSPDTFKLLMNSSLVGIGSVASTSFLFLL